MHFKLGLYEHQSAGAIEGALRLMYENDIITHMGHDNIEKIKCYYK